MRNPFQRWSLLRITGPLLAMRLRRRARKDEKDGFLFTAAMEWRMAAEVCAPNGILAGWCWREWERIMHLPRQMAPPAREASIVVLEAGRHPSTTYRGQPVVANSCSLPTAA
jgi:hypothetical protein